MEKIYAFLIQLDCMIPCHTNLARMQVAGCRMVYIVSTIRRRDLTHIEREIQHPSEILNKIRVSAYVDHG